MLVNLANTTDHAIREAVHREIDEIVKDRVHVFVNTYRKEIDTYASEYIKELAKQIEDRKEDITRPPKPV